MRAWFGWLAPIVWTVARAAAAQEAAPAPEENAIQEVEVRAPPPRASSGDAVIRGEDAQKTPGTQGDAVKAIQNLPAVSRSAFGSGQLVVWGSVPEDTRTYVDGIEVPSLYHVGGIRGVVGSFWIRRLQLLPGGFGVDEGGALGGVARIDTIALEPEGFHGSAGLDLFDASVAGTIASGRLRAGVGARYSYVDRILSAVAGSDIGDYVTVPRYHDVLAKVSVTVGEGQELDVLGLHSGDALDRVVPSVDPASRKVESETRLSERIGLRYRSAGARGATTVLAWMGHDESSRALDLGETSASRSAAVAKWAIRARHERALVEDAAGPSLGLVLGADASVSRTASARRGSLTIPPREGDVFVFGQPPGDETADDAWTTHVVDVDPFVALELGLGPVTLTPGVRMNGTVVDVGRATPHTTRAPSLGATSFFPSLDPRVALRARVGERLVYDLAAGLYHQAPNPEDLSPVFGTPTLGPSSAVHVTAGQSVTLHPSTTLEVVGFYKSLADLAVRFPAVNPPIAHLLSQKGEGRAYGVNLLLRQAPIWGFSGFISYALTRADRWAPWTTERLFDLDQTHVLTVVANQEFLGFTFGTRLRVATGMPRTPVVGAYYDAKSDRYDPIFGAQGTIRLPTFVELDARLERGFTLGPTELTVFLDVQNVTNQANVEELTYAYDFRQARYVTGLPILGVIGAKLDF